MKRIGRRIAGGSLLLALSLFIGLFFPAGARADSTEDNGDDLTLTVIDQIDDTLISDAPFEIYYIASLTKYDTFQMTEEFEDSGVSLGLYVTEGIWSERAMTLESYLVKRAAEGNPVGSAGMQVTGKDGTAVFDSLKEGLYLLVGEEVVDGNIIYTPYASLISLAHTHSEVVLYGLDASGQDDNFVVYVKNEMKMKDEPSSGMKELSVIKIWKDSGKEKKRPLEVTVTLYRNGEEYDTVKLSEDNSWKYTWTVPDDASRWQLTERVVPQGYTVTVVQDGNAFIVTNTYKKTTSSTTASPSPEPSASPSQPVVTPTPSEPVPSSSPSPAEPTPSEEPAEPTLPQTGQMWWPVCLLAGVGLVLFLIGFGLWKKGSDADEKE